MTRASVSVEDSSYPSENNDPTAKISEIWESLQNLLQIFSELIKNHEPALIDSAKVVLEEEKTRDLQASEQTLEKKIQRASRAMQLLNHLFPTRLILQDQVETESQETSFVRGIDEWLKETKSPSSSQEKSPRSPFREKFFSQPKKIEKNERSAEQSIYAENIETLLYLQATEKAIMRNISVLASVLETIETHFQTYQQSLNTAITNYETLQKRATVYLTAQDQDQQETLKLEIKFSNELLKFYAQKIQLFCDTYAELFDEILEQNTTINSIDFLP